MRKLFVMAASATLLALASQAASAQTAAPTADEQLAQLNAASDLVETLNLQQMMTQLSAGTSTAIITAIAQSGEVNDETRTAVQTAVRNQLATKLPEIIPLLAPVTAEAFSVEELEAMNEFYGSDVGQSIIGKLPAYQAASSRLMAAWMQQSTPPLQAAILDELKAGGIEVPSQGQPAAPAQ